MSDLVLTYADVQAGSIAFRQKEKRDAMYETATFLVQHFWAHPRELTNGLGVLLLTWNHAIYRYGLFDFDVVQQCIENNASMLNDYRDKNISDANGDDEPNIKILFGAFRIALAIADGKKAGIATPVGTAKALHLLAPAFFPLWDKKIAEAYDCAYGTGSTDPSTSIEAYLRFFRLMKKAATDLQPAWQQSGEEKSILKILDEYNYAKFTKEWI